MLSAWNKIKELINKKQNILNITTGIEYETGRIIDGKKSTQKELIAEICQTQKQNMCRQDCKT